MRRVVSAREQVELLARWHLAAPGDYNPGTGLPLNTSAPRPGTPNGAVPVLPQRGNQTPVPDAEWVNQDWRTAEDGGAFHSKVRPPMSSDIPHPSKVLDPNNANHTKPRSVKSTKKDSKGNVLYHDIYHLPSWIDQAANSADPVNDPWGVLTAPHKVERHYPNGAVEDITAQHADINTPEDLVVNHLSHHDAMTPDQAYQGRVWYRAAHEATKDLSDKTIGDHGKTVHTMSAFSPKTDWDENLEKGHHFMTHYSGDPEDPPVIPGMQSPVRKAVDIYHRPDGEYQKVNKGPKTSAFANNILDKTPLREPRAGEDDDAGYYEHPVNPHTGEPDWRLSPDQDMTVDTHHIRMANTPHGDDDALRNLKYETPVHFGPTLTVKGREIDPAYDLYARMGWEATRRNNLREQDPHRHLLPKQMQAGPWGKFKDDLDRVKGKTPSQPGVAPQSWPDNPTKKNVQIWKKKHPLNKPIPRYQRSPGDWTDPRRPELDLRSAPGWGRRSFVGSASPWWDNALDDYITRHPQHLADRIVQSSRAAIEQVDRLLTAAPLDSYPEVSRREPHRPLCTCAGRSGWDGDCPVHGLDAMARWESRGDSGR